VDEVFKALADPQRRKLLDRLFKRDGQTLSELCERMPMTRFGVMKHLRTLEEAGLVTSRMHGREKLHFLNPMPIRLIFDRWTSKYAEPFTRAMSAIKHTLEEDMSDATAPKHVYEVYIRTSPDKLWRAITDGEWTRKYFYGTTVKSTWKAGAEITYRSAEGNLMVDGKVIEADPPKRLVQTWTAQYDPETAKERPSRVTWTIESVGRICKLTVVHDDFDGETKTFHAVQRGWNPVLSGLKTLLETGEALELPAM
jgi:uncharacterized protein YndB with AHSA1/START domain/DNA-binding MarR family transcriptional regulator